MTSILQKFLTESPFPAVFVVFWVGAIASLGSCTLVRMPILLGCYKRLNDTDREADILEELRRHYPDSSKMKEETQAIGSNPSNIGIREKRDTSP